MAFDSLPAPAVALPIVSTSAFSRHPELLDESRARLERTCGRAAMSANDQDRRRRLQSWLASLAVEADAFAKAARDASETQMAAGFDRAAASLRIAAREQGAGIE